MRQEDQSPTVTLVSSTWRASVFEVRGVDSEGVESVRWVTVPRRDVERFTAAVASGTLAVALRGVLDVEGRFVPTSLDDGFGVFDVRPDGAMLLAPERGDKVGRRSERAERASSRPQSRQLALIAGAGAAVVTLGLVAIQAFGDGGASTVAPVTEVPVTTTPPTTAAPTTSTSTTSTPPTTTTLPPLVGPLVVVTPELQPTVGYLFDETGRRQGSSSSISPIVLTVDCAEPSACTVTVSSGLPNPVTLPIVDGVADTAEIGVPFDPEGCPPEWLFVVTPNLVFEFEAGRAAPSRVAGTLEVDLEAFGSASFTCLGVRAEWEIDSPLVEP